MSTPPRHPDAALWGVGRRPRLNLRLQGLGKPRSRRKVRSGSVLTPFWQRAARGSPRAWPWGSEKGRGAAARSYLFSEASSESSLGRRAPPGQIPQTQPTRRPRPPPPFGVGWGVVPVLLPPKGPLSSDLNSGEDPEKRFLGALPTEPGAGPLPRRPRAPPLSLRSVSARVSGRERRGLGPSAARRIPSGLEVRGWPLGEGLARSGLLGQADTPRGQQGSWRWLRAQGASPAPLRKMVAVCGLECKGEKKKHVPNKVK